MVEEQVPCLDLSLIGLLALSSLPPLHYSIHGNREACRSGSTFMHQVMKARAVPREIRMSSAHRRTFRSTFASTSSPIRGVANWDRFLVCHPHLFLFYLILLTSSVLAVATTDELLTQNMNVFNTVRKVFVCSI